MHVKQSLTFVFIYTHGHTTYTYIAFPLDVCQQTQTIGQREPTETETQSSILELSWQLVEGKKSYYQMIHIIITVFEENPAVTP